jgi:predicted membrane protein
MPIMFLFSAVVSGIALLVIMYNFIMLVKGWVPNDNVVKGLGRWLWLFLILTVTIELLEIMTLAYKQGDEWEVVGYLLGHQLSTSFIVIQMVLGAFVPFLLLLIIILSGDYIHPIIRNRITVVAACLLMMQVFSMRWNIVVGGQIFSKSMVGFRDYKPNFFDKEGILAAVIIFIIPFVVLFFVTMVLPVTKDMKPIDNGSVNPIPSKEKKASVNA